MEPIDIKPLIRRRPRKQTGQYRETDSAFFIRFYRAGKRVEVKVADKSAQYQRRADVEHLITKLLAGDAAQNVSTITGIVQTEAPPVRRCRIVRPRQRTDIEKFAERSGSPQSVRISSSTFHRGRKHRAHRVGSTWPRFVGGLTRQMVSLGVFEHAIATGVVQHNPCRHAQPLCKVPRKKRQHESIHCLTW